MRQSTAEDFWAKLKRVGDCLEWQGALHTTGYGWVMFQGQNWKSHRLAYTLAIGPIPPADGYHGNVVMHTCDNRRCCNPAHLRLGTQADNMTDMKAKGRRVGVTAGERNGRAKLTDCDVAVIARSQEPASVLAARYNVEKSTINRAKRRAA